MPVRALRALLAAVLLPLGLMTSMSNELPVVERAPDTPEAWLDLLKDQEGMELRQSWRSDPEPGLSPGRVWFVRDATHLHAFARLEDRDIRSTATAYNQFLFAHGDVFELFVHPRGAEPYWEFHVSPTGVSYQVRFDSAAGFAARRRLGLGLEELLAPYLLPAPLARVRAWVSPPLAVWHAWVSVPLEILGGADAVALSAARYDSTAGAAAPVLSCSAPLTKLDFHRLDEFSVFTLAQP